MAKKKEALGQMEQIKAVYEDGKAVINGREYVFTVMTFSERRKVFAYMSSMQEQLNKGDFSFLEESKYREIERDIFYKRVTVDGMSLFKKNVLEENPEDYIIFVSTALMVISYPFLKGTLGE